MKFKAQLQGVTGLERPIEIFANDINVIVEPGSNGESWAEKILRSHPNGKVVVSELSYAPVMAIEVQSTVVVDGEGKRSTISKTVKTALGDGQDW